VNGEGTVTIDDVLETNETIQFPEKFSLNQIYPNPFNPMTSIQFSVESFGETSLQIFDLIGRLVETLVQEKMEPGSYKVNWHPTNMSSGLYFVELKSGDQREIQKITYLK
jgi:hypothetical protein